MAEVLCTTQFASPIGQLRIVSSPKGVVYVGLPKASGRGFEGWRKTRAKDSEVVERRTGQEDAIDQILEFLEGERREFEIDLDLRATPFQLDVYKVVAKVGYGQTCSYLDIAEAAKGGDGPEALRGGSMQGLIDGGQPAWSALSEIVDRAKSRNGERATLLYDTPIVGATNIPA